MVWIIVALAVAAVSALVWWTSGRARADLRRDSINTEIGKAQGRAGMYGSGFPHSGGPTPGGGSF